MDIFSQKPRLGGRREGTKRGRLLFVCFFDPNGISTVYENIALWQACSEYELRVLNLWPGRGGYLQIPSTIQIDDYDGVLVHSTASYFTANLHALDTAIDRRFARYDGMKILMKQDEQVHTDAFAKFIGQAKFDLVVTCVPESEVRKAYPKQAVGEARFLHAYTGYVSPTTRALRDKYARGQRRIDVSYRGSIQPLQFGRLGFEKRKIGSDVLANLSNSGLRLDISSRWEDRVMSGAWFDFLGASKVALGVESGSNLFDFDGGVERWCADYVQRNADRDPLSDAYYYDADREHLHKFEGNVNYAQISPRHLEAACAGAGQILYEGEYSGIFKPGQHYAPLKRDLSNIQEALEIVFDERARSRMVERTFDEIIDNQDLQYESFVARFDAALIDLQAHKERPSRRLLPAFGRAARPRTLIVAAHEPVLDPRLEWFARTLAPNSDVCELGTYRFGSVQEGPSLERVSKSRIRVRVERLRHDWNWVPSPRDGEPGPGQAALLMLKTFWDMPRWALTQAIGAIDYTDDDISRFRELCKYFVNTNGALIEAGRDLGRFDAIVACDLETLPAAITLAREWGAALLFDSHEYWPYSYLDFRSWECEFWSGVERMLVKHADRRISVSPQLAQHLEQEYGAPFGCAPNCTLAEDAEAIDIEAKLEAFKQRRHGVNFLFQGGFAPGRGIEDLLHAWAHVSTNARLFLRGVDNIYKTEFIALAERLGLLNRSVFFPPPVTEAQLVSAATEADVGIIPYSPVSIAYRFASPNKLSQYMAAGLAILSNELPFVRQVIEESRAGAVVDFTNHVALAEQIDRFVRDRDGTGRMCAAAYAYFVKSFNWEVVSKDTIDWLLTELDKRRSQQRAPVNLSWIDKGQIMRQRSDQGDISAAAAAAASLPPTAAQAEIIAPTTPAPEPVMLETFAATVLVVEPPAVDHAAIEASPAPAIVYEPQPPQAPATPPPVVMIVPAQSNGYVNGSAATRLRSFKAILMSRPVRSTGRVMLAMMPSGLAKRIKARIGRYVAH